jgi:outer membrane lipoprotein-sorting protein
MTATHRTLGPVVLAVAAALSPVSAYGQSAIIAAVLTPWSATLRAADVLAQSRAAYAALQSYADSGSVVNEFGSDPAHSIRERHRFRTLFRRPRSFLFDFLKLGGDRYVVWGDDAAFHSWWKTTGVQYDYPKGQGAGAFSGGAAQTKGSLVMIPPLLFTGAGLVGPLTEFGDAEEDGKEAVDGHDCVRLTGVAKDVYPSGKEVNVRKVTVWIDAKTMLVRRVFEDTPRGSMASSVNRYITTVDPQVNPKVEERAFRFVVPDSQR